MKRLGKVIAIIVVTVLVFSFPFWVPAVVFYLGPEIKSTVVKSPDGNYQAWIGCRGWMDSINSHLYVSKMDGSKKRSIQLPGLRGEVAWSPDSAKVAIAGLTNAYSTGECGFFVYDVDTGRSVEGPATRSEAKYQTPCKPTWVTGNKIVLAPRNWTPDSGFEDVCAKVRIETTSKGMSIVDLNAGSKIRKTRN